MQNRPEPTRTFGDCLRHYRQRAGLSQADLAERAGLTVWTISALERGVRNRPYPQSRRRLADALGLEEDERATFIDATSRSARAPLLPATARPMERQHNIIAPLTPLIGRAAEMQRLHARLTRQTTRRLITLTGFAGIGKTRLALQLVRDTAADFPDGTWFVELAPVETPDQATAAIARALDLRDIPDEPLIDRIVSVLAPKHALLVIDNCEHLLDVSSALIGQLLATCPLLRIVATSRVTLQIPGEQVWRIGPLDIPTKSRSTAVELADVASVRLFVSRAEAALPQFHLSDENAAAVSEICVRLDGIPLAIELTAGLLRVLTVEQLAERLGNTLATQTSGRRGVPGRQQSVRAALDWSYTLLTAHEQRLFERLATFRGGCDLEMAEAVCAAADLPTEEILELLAQLVDASLVQVDDDGPMARYRLLEPVRLYADEQLVRSGDAEAVAERHTIAFVALAERAGPQLVGSGQVAWFQRLDREHDNLQFAFRRLARAGTADAGLRMAVALAPFWSARSQLSEGRRWLATLLSLPNANAIPPRLRAAALLWSGELAVWQLDTTAATAALEPAIVLAREAGDERIESRALSWLGATLRRRAEPTRSAAALDTALALAHRANDRPGVAFALINLGMTAAYRGDLGAGRTFLEESLSVYRSLGDTRYIAIASTILGEVVRRLGDSTGATLLLRDGLAGHRAVGDKAFIIVSLWQMAMLVATEQPDRAARLLGAIQTLHNALGAARTLRDGLDTVETTVSHVSDRETLVTLRARLSAEALAGAVAEGRMMTLERASAEALAAIDAMIYDPIPQS